MRYHREPLLFALINAPVSSQAPADKETQKTVKLHQLNTNTGSLFLVDHTFKTAALWACTEAASII